MIEMVTSGEIQEHGQLSSEHKGNRSEVEGKISKRLEKTEAEADLLSNIDSFKETNHLWVAIRKSKSELTTMKLRLSSRELRFCSREIFEEDKSTTAPDFFFEEHPFAKVRTKKSDSGSEFLLLKLLGFQIFVLFLCISTPSRHQPSIYSTSVAVDLCPLLFVLSLKEIIGKAINKKHWKRPRKELVFDFAEKESRSRELFPEGYSRPLQYRSLLASGVGVIIKHHAPLKNVHNYKDLSQSEKDKLYGGLMVDFIKQDAWESVCDRIESLEFKVNAIVFSFLLFIKYIDESMLLSYFLLLSLQRSLVNIANRKKLPYRHTSGSKSFHARLAKMEELQEKKRQRVENGEPVVEDEILAETLSKRPGYVSGMVYGVLPPKIAKDASSVGSSSGNATRLAEQLR
ncbi:hypothetical protein M9H77_26895 [Catharanthus roseus]|uniref:Uncharacterized protein n=1 Tax=Catharanthus roseus TaxID=4058 RepID=A0ACC0ACE0_CATRO|nr:hypothetical protein M9H77_26895 [Catharanthus roseus]